jgi:pimeloyl-ACP methyl ester carboxylesterase
VATARINGIDLYYEEHGPRDGEPILLIMGFLMNAGAWGAQIPALTPRFRVLAYDNRGSGRSSQPEGAYSIAQLTDDAAALMAETGMASAHVVGASMGGMIAQELTLRHPERVRSLVLLCTSPGGPQSAGYARLKERSSELFEVKDIAASMTPERAREFALELFTPAFLANPGPGFMQMAGTTMQYPASLAGAQAQMRAIVAHDTYDRLPQIRVPTLVMAGEDDPMIEAQNSRILAQRIPGAELRMFPGLRHGFTAERPDEVNAAIVEFLSRQAAAAA